MKKLLAVLLLAALTLPSMAQATAYHVNSRVYYAKDTNVGTSATTPKKTFASAAHLVRPGDSLYVYPGTYTWADLDSAGSNPTAGGYIAVVAVVPSGAAPPIFTSDVTINTPETYLYGVTIAGGLTFGVNGRFCRVVNCTVTGTVDFAGASYSTLYGGTVNGAYLRMGANGGSVNIDSISTVNFTGLGNVLADGSNYPIIFGCNSPVRTADSCVIYNNTINMTAYSKCPTKCDNNEFWTELFFETTNLRWVANHEAVTVQPNGLWTRRFRDDSHDYLFERDTVTATGPGGAQFMASSYGSGFGPVYNGTIDSSYYNFGGTQDGGQVSQNGLWFYFGMYNIHITRTTVIARGHALTVPTAASHNVLDHDTFVSSAGGGTLRFGYDRGDLPCFGDSAITISNSIIATLAPFISPQVPITGYDSNGIHALDVRCGVFYDKTAIDSIGSGPGQRRAFAHHNLYSYFGNTAAVGDNSIVVWGQGDAKFSPPGDNTATENAYSLDSLGTYGSAQFDRGGRDSTIGSFNPRIGPFSAAIGHDQSAGDIGAVAYVGTPHAGVSPSVVYFRSGVREMIAVSISNVGDGTLTLSKVCAPSVTPILPPAYVGYHKPTDIYPYHVAWTDASSEGTPDPDDGLGGGGGSGDSPAVARIFYDGTGAAVAPSNPNPNLSFLPDDPPTEQRQFCVLTNDPTIPITTPVGCTAGRWIVVPIYIR